MHASGFELQQALEEFLVYGAYPEVLLEPDHTRKAQILNELVSSYLFKDVFMELMKQSNLTGALDSYYFWRTHAGQEIDIIKESGGQITGIEAKWMDDVARPPSAWRAAYPDATFMVINRTNYLDVLRPSR